MKPSAPLTSCSDEDLLLRFRRGQREAFAPNQDRVFDRAKDADLRITSGGNHRLLGLALLHLHLGSGGAGGVGAAELFVVFVFVAGAAGGSEEYREKQGEKSGSSNGSRGRSPHQQRA